MSGMYKVTQITRVKRTFMVPSVNQEEAILAVSDGAGGEPARVRETVKAYRAVLYMTDEEAGVEASDECPCDTCRAVREQLPLDNDGPQVLSDLAAPWNEYKYMDYNHGVRLLAAMDHLYTKIKRLAEDWPASFSTSLLEHPDIRGWCISQATGNWHDHRVPDLGLSDEELEVVFHENTWLSSVGDWPYSVECHDRNTKRRYYLDLVITNYLEAVWPNIVYKVQRLRDHEAMEAKEING